MVSSAPTFVGGTVQAGIDYDTTPDGSDLAAYLGALEKATEQPLWGNAITVPFDASKQNVRWYKTDVATQAEDAAPGYFLACLGAEILNLTSGNIPFSLWADYEVEATGAKNQLPGEADNLVFNAGTQFDVAVDGHWDSPDFRDGGTLRGWGVYEIEDPAALNLLYDDQGATVARAVLYNPNLKIIAGYNTVTDALNQGTVLQPSGTGTPVTIAEELTFLYVGTAIPKGNAVVSWGGRNFRRHAGGAR